MKKGWEYKTLGEVCEVIAGQSPEGRFYNHDGNGTPFYQGKKEFTDRYIGAPTTWTIVETKIAEENDILMSVRAPVGDINIATQRMCIGRGLAAIRHGKTILTKFLYHYLQSQKDNITGREGAVFPTINRQEIMSIYIPVPPLEEQKKVVLQLDKAFEKIDTLRHNAEKSITTAQQLFQSSLTNLLTPQPHWDRKTLGAVCEVINGLWKGKKEPFVNVGVIRNTNFTKDFALRYDNIEWLDVEARQFAKRKLCKGDLIVEKSGGSEKQPVGRAVLFEMEDGEYSFSNFTSVLRIKDKQLTCYYLYYYLLSVYLRGDTKSMQKATTGIHNIEMDKYLLIPIPIIPLPEQATIVTKLNSLSAKVKQLKDNYTRTVALCDEMKQALLKEVFE